MRQSAFVLVVAHLFLAPIALGAVVITEDTVGLSFRDKDGQWVSVHVPAPMNNDQCARRLYGTPPAIGDMFVTLYHPSRRTESYEIACRRLAQRPDVAKSRRDTFAATLKAAGIAADDADLILTLIERGSQAIDKRYAKGGALPADIKNKLATFGRRLNAARKHPAFSALCIAVADVKATLTLGDVVLGGIMEKALANDLAEDRIALLEAMVAKKKADGEKVDPALEAGVRLAKTNIEAARSTFGAVAVSINDRKDDVADASVSLGSVLLQSALKASGPAAGWIWAPVAAYSTLRNISNQWEAAQDATTMATLVAVIQSAKEAQLPTQAQNEFIRYGTAAFYSTLAEVFNTPEAKLKDFLTPGGNNRDLKDYYDAQLKAAKAGIEELDQHPQAAAESKKEIILDLGNRVTMKLVLIPPGKFAMGSPDGENYDSDAETQHDVTLTKTFHMGVTEVTQEQYEQVMGKNPSIFKGAQNPVETVTWGDAQEFCKKLSQKTGKTVRLPTEAEWEYACRAGENGKYGGTGNLDEMGWYGKNAGGTTRAVGQKKANAWGLYDMHGNVQEWCQDAYKEDITKETRDPKVDGDGKSSRVSRGGSWARGPRECRCACRGSVTPDDVGSHIFGFRVCVDSP